MGMQEFATGVITKVLADKKVQEFIENTLSSIITKKIAPLVPLAAAAAVKSLFESVPALAHLKDEIGDVVQVADQTREELNKIIPDIDIGIPLIDNFLDVWRPKA